MSKVYKWTLIFNFCSIDKIKKNSIDLGAILNTDHTEYLTSRTSHLIKKQRSWDEVFQGICVSVIAWYPFPQMSKFPINVGPGITHHLNYADLHQRLAKERTWSLVTKQLFKSVFKAVRMVGFLIVEMLGFLLVAYYRFFLMEFQLGSIHVNQQLKSNINENIPILPILSGTFANKSYDPSLYAS